MLHLSLQHDLEYGIMMPVILIQRMAQVRYQSECNLHDQYWSMHVDLDLEGFEDMSPTGEPTGIALPYIVTIDEGSGQVLSIRRNFEEGSSLAKKQQYFVHYKFMPGLGFYGFGLIHMIGGLGRAATSILRQLIDAGTLANLPAGLSAVFDEVTIKERLVVEGGSSNQVLSQFDGPVTFNEKLKATNTVKISNEIDSTGATSGALVVVGGVGIGKTLSVGGDIVVTGNILPSSDSNSDIGSNSLRFANVFADNLSGNASNLTGISTLFDSSNNPRVFAVGTGATISGELQVSGDITAFFSSHERLKDNVTAIDDPLAKVLSLGGYTFDWNENTNNEGSDTGVIAQEIETLGLPGLVTTRDNGYKAVRYEKLVPLLVEAIKELSDKIETLEQKLSDK